MSELDAYALEMVRETVHRNTGENMWTGAPLDGVKGLPATTIGTIGEDLTHGLCGKTGLLGELSMTPAGGRGRMSWDIRIEGRTFEIKTATLGADGRFQFNNVHTEQRCDALLVIAITPARVLMQAWTRERVKLGDAGRIVDMASGVPVLGKLTRRESDLLPLDGFEKTVRGVLRELDMGTAIDRGPRPTSGSPGRPC